MRTKKDITLIKKLIKELVIERTDRYMIQLSNSICIVGDEFSVMRTWKRLYSDKEIVDMFRINRNRNQLNDGVTSLDKIIDISNELPD